MRTYRYVARDSKGKKVTNTIRATNKNLAIDTLISSRMKLIEIAPASVDRRLKPQPYSVFLMTKRLALMMAADVHVLRALQVLFEQEEDLQLKPIIMNVLHDVNTGSSLTWAMSKHPTAFSEGYVGMVKAGDTRGLVAQALNHLAGHLEHDQRIRWQAKSSRFLTAWVIGCIGIVSLGSLVWFIAALRGMH